MTARARHDGGRVRSVRLRNVPSFVAALDQEVEGSAPITDSHRFLIDLEDPLNKGIVPR